VGGKSEREEEAGVTGGGRRRQSCKGYGSKYVGATPQCSNSIDYCCWCTFLPALTYDKRAPIPGAHRPSHLPGRIDQPRQDFSLKIVVIPSCFKLC